METALHDILNWSEVWAVLIPMVAFFYFKPMHYWRKPVVIYVFVALVLNLAIDVICSRNNYIKPIIDNGILYNIHSIARFFLFSWFFRIITSKKHMYRVVEIAFAVLALAIFSFLHPPNTFNSPLLTCEAVLLLFYCLHFFYTTLREDKNVLGNSAILIVSGLCFYTAVNFFIFLFYNYLSSADRNYAIDVWDIHNITYIIFCIFIARAFKNPKPKV